MNGLQRARAKGNARAKIEREMARVRRLSLDDLSEEVRETSRLLDQQESAEASSQELVDTAPSPGNGSWRDDAIDACGARRKGLARQWSGGQCLQGAIASLLGVDVAKVPNPEISYRAKADWHEHFNARLAKACGYRLEFLAAHACPPRQGQLWIAGIHEQGEDDGHAVVARDAFVVHDASGIYQGSLPMGRVTDGMILRPIRRVVPVLRSNAQAGHMVVPA